MSTAFPRTARALSVDSSLVGRLTIVSAVVLLGAWGVWFCRAHLPVYETSKHARLEVLRATDPVDAPTAGRVTEVLVTLDAIAREGDVLVRLDASAQQLQLDEARARRAGIGPQLEALRKQADAERRALETYRGEERAAIAEAESRVREAEITSRAGRVEAERNDRLFAGNLVTDVDRQRAHAESDRRAAAEQTASALLETLRRRSATAGEDRQSRIVSLDREAASLAADLASLEASLPGLEHEVERRTIRAPASGRIGETANVRVGQVLAQGDHVATIVASGDLRVVAAFAPDAFGRVRPGQSARVRLDSFPWTEYGALRATVSNVATELHDGEARVELTVDRSSAGRIPLQHGLPGEVDVTVEETTPASLVLRAAGKHGT
jgi:membrane fusion protein (multidrug efflux system)